MTYNDPDSGTLKFYLPAAAKGAVQVKATAPRACPSPRRREDRAGGRLRVDFPIKPGETRFEVSYALPYTRAKSTKVKYSTRPGAYPVGRSERHHAEGRRPRKPRPGTPHAGLDLRRRRRTISK